MVTDFFIYEINEHMSANLEKAIKERGFRLSKTKSNEKWYAKDDSEICIAFCEDRYGEYINGICFDMDNDVVRSLINKCPACLSNNLKIYISYGYKSEDLDKLIDKGKIRYSPAVYDRMGMSPPNKECLDCGCSWHNGADFRHLSELITSGSKITIDDL